MQGIRNLAGGDRKADSTLLSEARDEAISWMEADVLEMGGDAVVTVRMETSEITKCASEVIPDGTAVRLKSSVWVGRDSRDARVLDSKIQERSFHTE